MSKQKPKLAVELGVFVQHPDEPLVLGRVMAEWREGADKDGSGGVPKVKVTWPSLRTESDHKAADLTAVEKPKPQPKPKEVKSAPEPKADPVAE